MLNRPGQTLVEVLLSIAIIVVGLVSLVATLVNIQSSAQFSSEEAIALQIAKEPLEVARFIRDSNWLEREDGSTVDYADGLASTTETGDYTGIYTWSPATVDPGTAITFNFTADDASHATTTVYKSSNGTYRQFSTTPGGSWLNSGYSRFVTMYPICSFDGGVTEQFITVDGSDCPTTYAGTVEIGRQVVSTVVWLSHGNNHSRVLETRLYNWRYGSL